MISSSSLVSFIFLAFTVFIIFFSSLKMAVSNLNDFTDLQILPEDEINTFNDSKIEVFMDLRRFPLNTVFKRFNPRLKSDCVHDEWICFHEYPFTIGLTYPFPPLIEEFFYRTQICPAQLMPMWWRFLVTIHRLNTHYGLSIGLPEISNFYDLFTHGYRRFVFKRKPGHVALVSNLSLNDSD